MDVQFILIGIGGSLITLLLGIIAFFLKRLVDKIDTVANEVSFLKIQFNVVSFLEKELEELKKECASLRKSFNEIDKYLYAHKRNEDS